MRVPLAWLREYVHLATDPLIIIEHLAALGFPVETVITPPTITGVVVGRIVKLQPHPNADRLQLCEIDVQGERTLTIVTAATNVASGQVIPVARIGAQLPEQHIIPRKMRGIDSEGMLCSAAELGLPAAWFEDGILQLDLNYPLGENVVELLGLADPILDVEVTSNRPDLLSFIGLARELAAQAKSELHKPQLGDGLLDFQSLPEAKPLSITLQSADVAEFLAIEVKNTPLGNSPILRRVRLAQAGIRPINASVDSTNYVMLEYGHPLHLYDAQQLEGQHFIVRDALPGERLLTLDGVEHRLDTEHLVIADSHKILGLAGVLGGAASGIQTTTKDAILECAQFRGPRIRRVAASLGVRTEASTRFEKGLAHGMLHEAAARAGFLLQAQGAELSKPTSAGTLAPPAPPIMLHIVEVQRLLGFDPGLEHLCQTLLRLGFTLERSPSSDGSAYAVSPPAWRGDIHLPVDLIEEIARLIGYDQIQAAYAPVAPTHISSLSYTRERDVALALSRAGFQEVISLALEPETVRERWIQAGYEPEYPSLEIRNPLSADQRFLRFSLLPEMLKLLTRRSLELREGELHLFEIGHCFAFNEKTKKSIERREVLWCSARVRSTQPSATPWTDEHLLAFKGRTEHVLRTSLGGSPTIQQAKHKGFHPGKCGVFKHGESIVATIGAIDPRLLAAYELDSDLAIGLLSLDTLPPYQVPRYTLPSRYPSIVRDLALVLDATIPAIRVSESIAQAEPLVHQARAFDEFRAPLLGTEQKSITVKITLQRNDSTLTDADADTAVACILKALKAELGAELRR